MLLKPCVKFDFLCIDIKSTAVLIVNNVTEFSIIFKYYIR